MDAHLFASAQHLDRMLGVLQAFEIPEGKDPVYEDLRATHYFLQDRVHNLLDKLSMNLQETADEPLVDAE